MIYSYMTRPTTDNVEESYHHMLRIPTVATFIIPGNIFYFHKSKSEV